MCKGFPGSSNSKESACNAGDLGQEDPLEKGMAIHSSILAWRISCGAQGLLPLVALVVVAAHRDSFSSKEQVSFNFMAAVTICSDFGAQENKVCHCFLVSPSICHEVMGPDAMILVF